MKLIKVGNVSCSRYNNISLPPDLINQDDPFLICKIGIEYLYEDYWIIFDLRRCKFHKIYSFDWLY